MRRGWFVIDGVQDGDRTLEQQLSGLGPLMSEMSSRPRVFEFGCAEGLILAECMRRGADEVWGVDIVPEAVAEANRQLGAAGGILQINCGVQQQDLNADPTPLMRDSDIVLMLAVLHKLRNPLAPILATLAKCRPDLIVIRCPRETPGFVQDQRSGMVRFEVGAALEEGGYERELVTAGHLEEWTGYYRRAA